MAKPEQPRPGPGVPPAAAPPPAAPPDLYRKLVALNGVRLLVGTALLVATAWLTIGPTAVAFGRPVEGLLYGIIGSIYLGSLVAVFFLRKERYLRQIAYFQIGSDILAGTGLVYLTGGAESIFTILYPLAIVNGAIGLGRRGAIVGASWSAAAFCVLALTSEFGLISSPVWFERPPLPLARLLLTLAANLSAFILTAALAGHLADALLGARRQLEKAETELTVLSALHEGIVHSISSGILTIDGASRITFVNPAGEEITGKRLRDLRGQRLDERLPEFAEAMRRSQPGRGETSLRHPDGSTRVVGYSLAPLVETGTPSLPGFVIVFQDLTKLRSMEEAVRRADRLAAVGKLAAGLAHEIRNPLASMSGSIELLSAGQSLPEKDRRLMRIVQREAVRLEALVKDFLSFARPSTPDPKPIDASRLIEEMMAMLRPTLAPRGLTLLSEVPPSLWVLADEGQLRQVMWNLLGNAADATSHGGQLRVQVWRQDGRVRIVVEDSGVGIAAEDLPRIFDPFFTTKERGTGLGLAIVHRIIEAHGGQLEVSSEPGHGSVFAVSLAACAPGMSSDPTLTAAGVS